MSECRCMCSPCNHKDHCGGEVCPFEKEDDRCGFCRAPIEECLNEPCVGSLEYETVLDEWLQKEFEK